jgi:hypothetical protein
VPPVVTPTSSLAIITSRSTQGTVSSDRLLLYSLSSTCRIPRAFVTLGQRFGATLTRDSVFLDPHGAQHSTFIGMLPRRGTSARHFLLLRIHSARGLLTPFASSPASIKRPNLLGLRATHTFPSPKVYQPLPYKNWYEAVEYYVKPERYAITVEVRNVLRFTMEEDIRQLFVESELLPELILMSYQPDPDIRLMRYMFC